ncbi:MAG: DUF6691 family protein [Gemmatimonadota bacterium]|nr:DUF6691 family protein [Gemmatimonadota bacterium]
MTRSSSVPGGAAIPARALLLGVVFGVILVKSEAVSWYRIQEMFRFQGFHMYGILGSAVLVGLVSLTVLRARGVIARDAIPPKQSSGLNRGYWIGGTVFGLGWGLLGACPGPVYALIGTGATVFLVALASALVGTWVYAATRDRLPHA